ncbi:MAG: hypothetical protein JSV52_13230 [Candidatus Zixiibacteriota bacterium]|nr:MAG: hypothetical protein JSV52_13230 [candidate division Zixibacteria bacterium]
MIRRLLLVSLSVLLGLAFVAPSAAAQEQGTIQALATVISSLNVVGTNNLQFGTVTPGVNKAVDKANVSYAGEWTVTGTSNAEVTVDFVLPSSLATADSLAFMNIIFSGTDASYDDGTGGGQTAPAGVIDPNGPSTLNISAGGTLMIWIGGMVLPTVSQTGGDYANDVVLTVAYTGS